MKSIYDMAPKPSDAIYAMVAGLIKAIRRQYVDFKLDMSTFGGVNTNNSDQKVICVGCAATVTLFELHNKQLDKNSIWHYEVRASHLEINADELSSFEDDINMLRQGYVRYLLCAYWKRNLIPAHVVIKDEYHSFIVNHNYLPDLHLPSLQTGVTKKQLSFYTLYTDKLKSLGI